MLDFSRRWPRYFRAASRRRKPPPPCHAAVRGGDCWQLEIVPLLRLKCPPHYLSNVHARASRLCTARHPVFPADGLITSPRLRDILAILMPYRCAQIMLAPHGGDLAHFGKIIAQGQR